MCWPGSWWETEAASGPREDLAVCVRETARSSPCLGPHLFTHSLTHPSNIFARCWHPAGKLDPHGPCPQSIGSYRGGLLDRSLVKPLVWRSRSLSVLKAWNMLPSKGATRWKGLVNLKCFCWSIHPTAVYVYSVSAGSTQWNCHPACRGPLEGCVDVLIWSSFPGPSRLLVQ